MFFWKIKDLKNTLIRRELSERQVFGYILISMFLSIIAVETTRHIHPDRVGLWDYVNSFLNISIVFLGTVFAYRANGGASGVDFAARFFSISLVVSIRHLFFSDSHFIDFLYIYYLFVD